MVDSRRIVYAGYDSLLSMNLEKKILDGLTTQ